MRQFTLRILTALGLFAAIAGMLRSDDAKDAKPAPAIAAEDPKLGRPVDFERDVYPILDAKCIACHNVAINENGLNLEDVKNILKGGKRGPAAIAKDPEKSPLFKLAARAAEPAMPPLPNKVEAAALTPKELGIIRQWILEGASAGMGGGGNAINWQPIPKGVHPIYAAALTADGQFAAAGRGNTIGVYHIPSGEQIAELSDPALLAIQHNGKAMYEPGAAHRDFVHSLAFSPTGNMLASGSYREVKLWTRPENVQRLNISASTGPVPAIAVSGDDKWLAAAAADNSIKLYSLADGQPGKILAGHSAAISGLAFSPDHGKLYSTSHDKTIRVWNLADGAAAGQIEAPAAVTGVAVTPDGTKLVVSCADNRLRVVTLPAGAPPAFERELTGHGGPVSAVAIVPPQGARALSGSDDGTVRLWDLASGKEVASLNHGGPVTAVAVNADGTRYASASANHTAKIWESKENKQVAEMKGDLRANRVVATLTADDAEAKGVVTATTNAIPAADKVLAEKTEAQKKVAEAKAAAEKTAAEMAEKVKAPQAAFDAAKKAADDKKDDEALKKAAADAEKALKDAQAAAKKADDEKAAAIKNLEQADRAVADANAVLVKAKADHEAAVARQKAVETALSAAKTQATAKEKPFRAIRFSRDGKELAVTGDEPSISTFDGASGAPLGILDGHAGPVLALAYGPGRSLVSGSADQTAKVWNLNPAWTLAAVLGPKKEAPLDLYDSSFVSRVLAVAFSPDGALLATGGGDPSRSGELTIWDVANRTLVRNLENAHSDTVFGVEFSRDGRSLLSGAADKFVKIHDVATGKFVKSFEGHTNHVLDVTWRHGDKQIASAGADNVIKVWTVETGEQARTIGGYAKQVTSIEYVGRGPHLISCGGDKTVRLHSADNGSSVRTFAGGTDFMFAAGASADEKIVIAAGQDGVLRIWNGANGQVIKLFEPAKPAPTQQAQAK
jgi:WD40 repeat protein